MDPFHQYLLRYCADYRGQANAERIENFLNSIDALEDAYAAFQEAAENDYWDRGDFEQRDRELTPQAGPSDPA